MEIGKLSDLLFNEPFLNNLVDNNSNSPFANIAHFHVKFQNFYCLFYKVNP